jgi:hypothetical protein
LLHDLLAPPYAGHVREVADAGSLVTNNLAVLKDGGLAAIIMADNFVKRFTAVFADGGGLGLSWGADPRRGKAHTSPREVRASFLAFVSAN